MRYSNSLCLFVIDIQKKSIFRPKLRHRLSNVGLPLLQSKRTEEEDKKLYRQVTARTDSSSNLQAPAGGSGTVSSSSSTGGVANSGNKSPSLLPTVSPSIDALTSAPSPAPNVMLKVFLPDGSKTMVEVPGNMLISELVRYVVYKRHLKFEEVSFLRPFHISVADDDVSMLHACRCRARIPVPRSISRRARNSTRRPSCATSGKIPSQLRRAKNVRFF